jgi:hypothetical protein
MTTRCGSNNNDSHLFKVPSVPLLASPIENELALNSTFKILEEGKLNFF